MLLANLLKEYNLDITIFEKNNKLGKKILASGNGKCNLTNMGDFDNKYNNEFANKIVCKFNSVKTISFFEKIGLICKTDSEGRCYPVSECSSSVLDVLKINLKGVRVVLDSVVRNVRSSNSGYEVFYNDNKEYFDYIVCCSGSAASNLGNLKAYDYFSDLKVNMTDLKPSLVPLKVKEDVKELKGSRVKCLVKLINSDNKVIYEEFGEVMFKDGGLSGIAIFNASSYINRCNGKYVIELDLSAGLNEMDLFSYLSSRRNIYPNIFKGFLNDKLANYILKEDADRCSDEILNKIVYKIFHLKFNVVDTYPLVDSQVCHGGIALTEIDDNLELRKHPNAYVGGELLDIDGVCGGYNMQFAWSCAGVIAESIKNKLEVYNNEKR